MSRHTPGPWRVGSDGGIYASDRKVASCQSGGLVCVPDANLVAAAPEMLTALEEIMDVMQAVRNGDDFKGLSLANVVAAIAKAKGRS